jgi:hypothetical protein
MVQQSCFRKYQVLENPEIGRKSLKEPEGLKAVDI